MPMPGHDVAMGGGGFLAGHPASPLDDLLLGLPGRERPHVVFVSGGNTANMLAVWRVHGADAALRRAYEAGVILAGVSAGALCWFAGGVTDSFGALARLDDGLAFLDGTMCPHYDGEAERRPTYHALVAEGMPAGYAADDGCALHFVDGALREAVSSRPHARAYRVKRAPDGAVVETPLPTRFLSGT